MCFVSGCLVVKQQHNLFWNIALLFNVKIFLKSKILFKTSNAQVFLKNIINRSIKLHNKCGQRIEAGAWLQGPQGTIPVKNSIDFDFFFLDFLTNFLKLNMFLITELIFKVFGCQTKAQSISEHCIFKNVQDNKIFKIQKMVPEL